MTCLIERSALALSVCCVFSACGAQTAELPPQEAEPDSVRIEGTIKADARLASDVRVTGRCGQQELSAVTGTDGRYTFELGMFDCDRIVIEHEKTGFLPAYSVVPVSARFPVVELPVGLTKLLELECGQELCHTRRGTDVASDDGRIARGYQFGEAGERALDRIPPDMRADDGELISFLGYQYLEVYDKDGARLEETSLVQSCTRIDQDGLSWVGDVDPSTPQVDLDWYHYDKGQGRWYRAEGTARLMYRRGNVVIESDDGLCIEQEDDQGRALRDLQPVERSMMPDVRAEEHYAVPSCSRADDPEPRKVSEYWVCGPVEWMGFYAYGRSAPEQSCYAMSVTDDCGEPLEGVLFSARGIEHGYMHSAVTGPDGRGCIDVMASEPIGEDYDLDELGGETFSVELALEVNGSRRASIDHKENAQDFGSCEEPETCVQLTQQLRGCNY